MRLPRVRFTVRRLMIAVAIAGVIMGVTRLTANARRLRARAAGYAIRAATERETNWGMASDEAQLARAVDRVKVHKTRMEAGSLDQDPSDQRAVLELMEESVARRRRRIARHHGRLAYFLAMRAKYERAARYPWLSVEPDPPEPE